MQIESNRLVATIRGGLGPHTAFVRVHGDATEFWAPVDIEIREPLEFVNVASRRMPKPFAVPFATTQVKVRISMAFSVVLDG